MNVDIIALSKFYYLCTATCEYIPNLIILSIEIKIISANYAPFCSVENFSFDQKVAHYNSVTIIGTQYCQHIDRLHDIDCAFGSYMFDNRERSFQTTGFIMKHTYRQCEYFTEHSSTKFKTNLFWNETERLKYCVRKDGIIR